MSTRHVWERFDTKYLDNISTVPTSYPVVHGMGANRGWVVTVWYSGSYTLDQTTGKFVLKSPTAQSVTDEGNIQIPAGYYFQYEMGTEIISYRPTAGVTYSKQMYQSASNESLTFKVYPDDIYTTVEIKERGNLNRHTSSQAKGDISEGNVASAASTTYPTDGIASSKYYVYLGNDSIDPTAVSILDTPSAGKEITVGVTSRTNTYGGTIAYAYEYSVDGGATWTAITTTTATSTAVTVPKGAETFRARVRASDNMGFTSTDYVYSAEVEAESGAVAMQTTVAGVAREVGTLLAGVDGIKREIDSTAIGVDGVTRV